MNAAEPVYLAADPIDAELVRGWLAERGIEVWIHGDLLWSGVGDLAANEWPRLYCRDPRDHARARQLIAEREQLLSRNLPRWRCSCGEWSPGSFEICWSCGAERPG